MVCIQHLAFVRSMFSSWNIKTSSIIKQQMQLKTFIMPIYPNKEVINTLTGVPICDCLFNVSTGTNDKLLGLFHHSDGGRHLVTMAIFPQYTVPVVHCNAPSIFRPVNTTSFNVLNKENIYIFGH